MGLSVPRLRDENPTDPLDRIVFFSDAVIAIAITLLVVGIEIPQPAEDETLTRALLGKWPDYVGFLLSFWVVGRHWMGHHRTFRYVVRWDRGLIYLNLVFLMTVAFLPFPTGVFGEHEGNRAAVVFYAAALSATGLASALLWHYVSSGRRLLDDELSDAQLRYLSHRAYLTPIPFLLSIPIAFASVVAAEIVWGLVAVILLGLRRLHPETV